MQRHWKMWNQCVIQSSLHHEKPMIEMNKLLAQWHQWILSSLKSTKTKLKWLLKRKYLKATKISSRFHLHQEISRNQINYLQLLNKIKNNNKNLKRLSPPIKIRNKRVLLDAPNFQSMCQQRCELQLWTLSRNKCLIKNNWSLQHQVKQEWNLLMMPLQSKIRNKNKMKMASRKLKPCNNECCKNKKKNVWDLRKKWSKNRRKKNGCA